MDEELDLGGFSFSAEDAEVRVWAGPIDSDPFKAFGPGTTVGGRAEAGWFELGTITEDGIKFETRWLRCGEQR